MVTERTGLPAFDPPGDKLLLFGGPYSNLAATRSLRSCAERLQIPPQQVFCNGDLVAYCGEPVQTVDEIRDWGIAVVMGNCEESLAANASDCGCGFASGTACALLSDHWYAFARDKLGHDSRRWMGSLPRGIILRFNGYRIMLVHGSPQSINRFCFASTPAADKIAAVPAAVDIVVGGHCGIPFGQQLDHRFWLNTGAIGMPANDGTPDGWYLLLTAEGSALRASWRRLEYDWQQSQRAMIAAGLDGGYTTALSTGLWPSMDVLPAAEKARRGLRLAPSDLTIERH